MCQIAIDIPNEVLYDTKMNREEANRFARCAVALGYYTQSGVSIGYCAQIAGLSKEEFIKFHNINVEENKEEEFIQYLGKNQVSIFHFDNREEFLEELNNA